MWFGYADVLRPAVGAGSVPGSGPPSRDFVHQVLELFEWTDSPLGSNELKQLPSSLKLRLVRPWTVV
jgi:hypothetical protein